MEAKDDELQTNFGATWCSIWNLELVRTGWGTAGHICANFATCSREPLTMLNPHFVAGEHGLFGANESEDIRTIFFKNSGTAWEIIYIILTLKYERIQIC